MTSVFYGYPLHAPGKPDKPRSEHFPTIAQPALFLQGTRDSLCQLPLLKTVLAMKPRTVSKGPVQEVVLTGDLVVD